MKSRINTYHQCMTALDSFQGLLLPPARKSKYLSAGEALGIRKYNPQKHDRPTRQHCLTPKE